MLTLRRMTSTAATQARSDRPTPPKTGHIDEARAAVLRAANINPRTGLATDYLNHFNEAIMLLEMIPDMPECAEDFLDLESAVLRRAFLGFQFQGPRSRDRGLRIGRRQDPRRVRQHHLYHDLDPDCGGLGDARGRARTRPAPRWPNRPPAGSSRWWRWPAASSTAPPRPTSKPSWRTDFASADPY